MLPFFWYMLKVIICSGILLGYYWLFLRNKIFHQYNRFYLLVAISLSLLLPLVKINFWQPAQQSQAVKVLQVFTAGDELVLSAVQKNSWDAGSLYAIIYILVSLIFLFTMVRTLILIRSLLERHEVQKVQDISFVNTGDASTPFSFLQYIFWNQGIDINSTTGSQIFKHEVAHVQEKHTHDKLFLNIVLIFFWSNPFFWLYRKELNMIHEFIADKKAVEGNDTAAFAAMILQAAYPKHRFELTNNFFYSPIKRRLMMLTKNENPRINYWGRIMVLPLAVLIFTAFTLKIKSSKGANENIEQYNTSQQNLAPAVISDTLPTPQQWKIAAGKNITDTIPKIKSLVIHDNANDKILIEVGGHKSNVLYVVDDVVKGDDFSLNEINPNNILRVEVIKNTAAIRYYTQADKDAVIVIRTKELPVTGVNPQLRPENDLLEKKLTELNAVREKQDMILEKKLALNKKYLEKIELAKLSDSLYNKRAEGARLDVMEERKLAELNAYNNARLAYSQRLDEVVVQGYTLHDKIKQQKATEEIAASKLVTPPMFMGGDDAWRKYLVSNLKANTPVQEGWKAGKYTVMVRFIVHADGSVSDITTENYKGTKTALHCINIIANAPRWQPAIQNGKKVDAFKKQPITFIVEEQ